MLPDIFLQLSDGEAFVLESIATAVATGIAGIATVITYYTLKRTPRLQTETQKAIEQLAADFNSHKQDDSKQKEADNKRFSDIWDKMNEILRDSADQSFKIKNQIAELRLSEVEDLTEIKVSLGKLTTSMTYIEGQMKLGLIEKAPS